jgi:rhamnose utilization protein RhaD (predicted bifunctional aldolase and dehydrogenase)
VLGAVHPSFFLLPVPQGEQLGIPVYEEKGYPMSQRAIQRCIQIRNWKDHEWPPECIIQCHGPATWAEDGSRSYQTPIYMLNHSIWLQAVVEIITNETAKALNI